VTAGDPAGDPAVGRVWLRASAKPLAMTYDVGLLDLDGVVYVGPEPVAVAPQAIAKARAFGMRLAFVTNNASRDPATVAGHLASLGIPASPEEVVTSAQAAARLIVEIVGVGARVLVIGSPALRAIIENAGLQVVASSDERPDAVVQGFWSELCYGDLAEATLAVRSGALWVATNVDSTLPSSRGLLPGNGSLVGVIAMATGRKPRVAGKPALPLHAEGVRRTAAKRPLVIGDRLDTDIEGANLAGTDSLLVLTGVTTPAELLSAPPEHRPTYLSADLLGLFEPQPEVQADSAHAVCNGWVVRRDDDAVTVHHMEGGDMEGGDTDGGALDGLRALLALSWLVDDAGEELVGADEALAKLGAPVG
jgi:HAD superfamily hydrolase (TIGR01450 family)